MATVALASVALSGSDTVSPPSTVTGVAAVLSPAVNDALPPLVLTTGTPWTLTVALSDRTVVSLPP